MEPQSEVEREPVPEPQVEVIAEAPAESAGEPQNEIKPAPVSEAPAGPVSESEVEEVNEPQIEEIIEPPVEAFSEPVVEPVIERPPEEEMARRAAPPAAVRRKVDTPVAEHEYDTEAEEVPGPVVWEKLIFDVRETLCKKALAQAMLAAKVISFNGPCLRVAFDSLYSVGESLLVMREKPLLDMRLAVVAERPDAFVHVERRSGLITPAQRKEKEDAAELCRKTEQNPFISGLLDMFDGVLTDVHHLDKEKEEEEI